MCCDREGREAAAYEFVEGDRAERTGERTLRPQLREPVRPRPARRGHHLGLFGALPSGGLRGIHPRQFAVHEADLAQFPESAQDARQERAARDRCDDVPGVAPTELLNDGTAYNALLERVMANIGPALRNGVLPPQNN